MWETRVCDVSGCEQSLSLGQCQLRNKSRSSTDAVSYLPLQSQLHADEWVVAKGEVLPTTLSPQG